MDETTNFYDEILSKYPEIVEYYTINPRDVIKLSKSKKVDAVMLGYLASEFKKKLDNEDLTLYNRTQITRTLIAIILAIKEIEKDNDLNKIHIK